MQVEFRGRGGGEGEDVWEPPIYSCVCVCACVSNSEGCFVCVSSVSDSGCVVWFGGNDSNNLYI